MITKKMGWLFTSIEFSMGFIILFFSSAVWFNLKALSEPWLSNRYAQNCSACHAPGRWNLNPSERRCTLSCQGCHVNPNGGGMRNQYGVWNQQRWLRSFYSDKLRNKRTPAPLKNQYYAKKMEVVEKTNSEEHPLSSSKDKKSRNSKKSFKRETASDGPPSNNNSPSPAPTNSGPANLVVTTNLNPNAEDYDRSDYNEWKTIADKSTFLSTIPQDDPYRLERSEWIYAGGDIRYIYGNRDSNGTKTDLSFPMTVDVGIRFRPVRDKLSFVLETRYFNSPSNKDLDDAVRSHSQVRSAYAIADNLWFNSWIMGGLYRPMFGNYIPDHNSLSQTMAFGSSSYRVIYKAVGLGGSPNVPYANIHAIFPMGKPSDQSSMDTLISQDQGVVANIGARAVTKSLSGNFSFWNTTNNSTGQKLIKQMIALSGGAMVGRLVATGEWLRIDEEFAPGKKNGGNVVTIDTKFRLWRENYTSLGYAYSNVSRSPRLGEGKSSEFYAGIKTFLLSGMEFEILGINRPNESNGISSTEKLLQMQAHLFF